MEIFRRLAGNIFFKIILGLVAVSFIFFGVSGFILGNPNIWVVKVGDISISQSAFNNAMRADREIVLATARSQEALSYLDSEKFKADVLGGLVNKAMIKNLREDFGAKASSKIIYQAIAKDPSFKNDSGKFDREKFRTFLSRNGLNEERYFNEVSSEVESAMILQSLTMAIPIHHKSVLIREKFKEEKRIVDILTITKNDVKVDENISKAELEEFFAQNRNRYSAPEMRKVSYLEFSKQDFAKDFKISDAEVLTAYEQNKDGMMEPERRDFYQIVFDKKEAAESFAKALNEETSGDKSKSKSAFAKLAKDLQKKDLKNISMNGVSKTEILESLSGQVFNLSLNQLSEPLESPLGFHLFLVNDIKKSQPIPFSKAQAGIRANLAQGREEKVLQNKISQIDEILLASGSLDEVAKKFNIKSNPALTINIEGLNEKGVQATEVKRFEDFAANIFLLKEGQVSKPFYTKNANGFYIVKLEKIISAREKELSEVEVQVKKDLLESRLVKAARDLANVVVIELKNKNPNKTAQTGNKHHIKVQRDLEFSRHIYLDVKGSKMPYQNKITKEIFDLKIGQVSDVFTEDNKEFKVIVLKDVKTGILTPEGVQEAQRQAINDLATEIMAEYNSYILKRYPVKINEKFFASQGKN